jgi:thiamine-phosphate pyrophosphorylase
MRLVVISPESADPREIDAVRAMLGRGLTRYHVRKPNWSEQQLVSWAEAFSPAERQRFVLHGDEALARRLGFGGVHWRDERVLGTREACTGSAGASPASTPNAGEAPALPVKAFVANAQTAPGAPRFLRSRSCHDLSRVRAAIGVYDAIFLSPVFRSVSKVGYGETRPWIDAELQDLLASRDAAALSTEVIALGGIQKSTTARCRELGFDGAAALGAIWQAADPVGAFAELRDALSAFAGRPLLAGAQESEVSGVFNFS